VSDLIITALCQIIKTIKYFFRILVSLGLIVMLIGSGSLKNNLNAFGGGQHKLPEQKKQLETYFSVQYFGVKSGSFLARIVFPMLREDLKCFGENDCYSMTFGIPTIIMICALIIFLLGTSQYKKLPPNGNKLLKVIQCAKVRIFFY
jgi:dipeptide/tripeptide permease